MKKFRKAIVALLAMVMVIGTLAITANAATLSYATITVAGEYQGWDNTDSTNVLTSTDGGATFSGTITIESTYTKQMTDLQLIGDNSWSNKVQAKLDDASASALESNSIALTGAPGTLAITFDATTQVMTVTGNIRTTVQYDDVYYVKGTLPGLTWDEDWSGSAPTGLMTEANGVHSITIENVAAGDYLYKVLHDPAQRSWTAAYAESGPLQGMANGEVSLSETSNVTISIDCSTNAVTVTVTPVQTPGAAPTTAAPTTAAPTTAAPTTGANNTTTAANNTTTAEPTSANNGGQGGNNVNDNTTGRTVAVVIAGVAVMLAATVAFVASKKRVTE